MGEGASSDGAPSPDLLVRRDWGGGRSVEEFIGLLRRSSTAEHYIYREAEADEFWRYLEDEIQEEKDEDRLTALGEMKVAVMRAHDLSAEGRVEAAADALQEAWQRYGLLVQGH